jgi:CheY-like chemotaxis protein
LSYRILLVDDNPTNLKLAADVLENSGYAVERAIDAEQAQQALEKSSFDLVLMDIALPGMDGLTLTRKLKADPRFQAIPIVALTASAMKGDDNKAREAGCEGYITKPIDTRKFAEQVHEFLPPGRIADTATREPQPEPQYPTSAKPLTIIVADDHPSNRRLLRAGLEAEGHRIIEAENGAEVLLILERERIDAVISDILMPILDGFRLCHEVRNSAKPYADLPFLLHTATYDSSADRDLAKTVGADAYLLKPASMSVILAALDSARARAALENTGTHACITIPEPSDDYVLKQYSAALVHKLEDRNVQLQQKVTELMEAQQEIAQFNLSLETRVQRRTAGLDAANKQLEAFSYSVAHDLRDPLHTIIGFADLLDKAAAPPLNDAGREFLAQILVSARRMDKSIADLLSFPRAPHDRAQAVTIDLEEILEQSLKELRTTIEGKHIEWRRHKLPRAMGDAGSIGKVLTNLLSNALKYSSSRDPAIIEIDVRRGRANEVVVLVRDNGVGFDMQRAEQLFGVFHRVRPRPEFEDKSVGLATARRIATRMGGRIWAEATVDRGATFYFSLPAARDSGAAD